MMKSAINFKIFELMDQTAVARKGLCDTDSTLAPVIAAETRIHLFQLMGRAQEIVLAQPQLRNF